MFAGSTSMLSRRADCIGFQGFSCTRAIIRVTLSSKPWRHPYYRNMPKTGRCLTISLPPIYKYLNKKALKTCCYANFLFLLKKFYLLCSRYNLNRSFLKNKFYKLIYLFQILMTTDVNTVNLLAIITLRKYSWQA